MDRKVRTAQTTNSLKYLIIGWVFGVMLFLVVFSSAFVLINRELRALNSKTALNSQALEVTYRLDIAILKMVPSNDSIAAAPQDLDSSINKARDLEQTKALAASLSKLTDNKAEAEIVKKIQKSFAQFDESIMDAPGRYSEHVNILADELLRSTSQFESMEIADIALNTRSIRRLNSSLDLWTLVLMLSLGFFLLAGSASLITRVARPSRWLTEAVRRFGSGDLEARAPVLRDDEIGLIARTFNDMAENMLREKEDRFQLTAMITHDLRSPLMNIVAAIYKLRKELPQTAETERWLALISKQIRAIENMTGDLMDSMRIEAGQLNVTLEELDLTALAKSIQTYYEETTRTHTILFEENAQCRVRGDAERLERVIANVLSNAIKYSPHNTSVALKIERDGRDAVISVTDEGCGISKEDAKRLFQPFGRLDATRGLVSGTGLGLFSARRIIEEHNGKIIINSVPGVCTSVEIRLPLIEI